MYNDSRFSGIEAKLQLPMIVHIPMDKGTTWDQKQIPLRIGNSGRALLGAFMHKQESDAPFGISLELPPLAYSDREEAFSFPAVPIQNRLQFTSPKKQAP